MVCRVHKAILKGEEAFGGKLPPHQVGALLAELPILARDSVSMALRNRSTVSGQRPRWLDRASDIRFVGHDGNGDSTLYFEAPTLGESATEIFAQTHMFPEFDQRPDPEDTAFDLLGDVIENVSHQEADSSSFDSSLLGKFNRFSRVFSPGPSRRKVAFYEVDLTSRRFPEDKPARLTKTVLESAKALLGQTPVPQRVRLVGKLDGLMDSRQRFYVKLDTGETAVCVYSDDQAASLKELWRHRVLVLGDAVYRASGRLLRIDADHIRSGENESAVFSAIPESSGQRMDSSTFRKTQGAKTGINAIIGKWPGDETDVDILAAMEELS